MKKLLVLAALMTALATLCSCSMINGLVTSVLESGEESSDEASAPASEPIVSESEKIIIPMDQATDEVFGMACESAESFNPITSRSRYNQDLVYLIYEGLFELTPDYQAEPALCESYDFSGDELVYTFNIRQGVTFQNGDALTADDVVYTLNQAWTSQGSIYSSRFHAFQSIESLDEYTVQVVLAYPYEQLPLILDIPIIPEGSIDDVRPAGTGPYKFAGTKSDFYLEGFDKWWKNDDLPFGRVYLEEAESSDTLRDDFETSKIDFLTFDPTGSSSITFHNDYELFQYGSTVLQYVGFNFGSEVFSNEYARRAVCFAVDRDAIVSEVYGGKAAAAVLPCREGSLLYDEALAKKFAFSTDKMKSIMQEGGFEALDETGLMYFETAYYMQPCSIDFIVNSENSYKVASAEKITEVLQNNGFVVNLETLSYDDYIAALESGDYDMYLAEVKLTADFDLTSILNYYGLLNYGDATYDNLNAMVYGALENSGAALDLYQCIYDHGLMAPVLFKNSAVIAPRGLITGITPSAASCFYGFTKWQIDFKS